jgi:DNA-binding CsgD family transcriptional regulator
VMTAWPVPTCDELMAEERRRRLVTGSSRPDGGRPVLTDLAQGGRSGADQQRLETRPAGLVAAEKLTSSWWNAQRAGGADLVRAAEWRQVREFVVGIGAREEPALLAVSGEAGAGKSTLWRAGLAAAVEAGYCVLRSEPSAAEVDASFAGLSDLLSGVLPDVVADLPGPQREALEVALLLRPAGDTPATAHTVALAVLTALRSCLQAGPVLVAIDDVQWLDAASLEALAFAVRRITSGPLGVLLAARTDAPADPLTVSAPLLPDRWRDLPVAVPGAARIDLVPLDRWQIQGLLPATVTAAQARLAAAQSRGNPFWALQVAASLDSAEAAVPPLALTLTRRLSQSLSAPAADALAVVAAAGRITVADATAVLDDLDDPAAALDAAVLAGVVVETEGRVAAAHPLIGAAAVQSLPPGRRLGIYRRLAEAATSPEHHAQFAALAAGPGPDPQVAAALDTAADSAYARAANAAAGQFAAQAVTFTPSSDDRAVGRRRIRAGELLFLAGDVDRSLEHLEALDTGRLQTPDLERALPLLVNTADLVHGAEAARHIVTRAMDAAGSEPRRRALALALSSDHEYGIRHGRRAAAVEAIDCAGAAGAAANSSLHRALLNLVVAKVRGGEGLDAELLGRAQRLEAELPAFPLLDSADLYRGVWARRVEDLDTARAALRRCIVRAGEAGEDWASAMCLSYLATVEELAGDYPAAVAALNASDAIAAWYHWPRTPGYLEPRCGLLIWTGNLDGALSLADEHLADDKAARPAARLLGAFVRGEVSMWRGDAAAVVRNLEQGLLYAEENDTIDPGARWRLDPVLAEAYVSVGRLQDASRIAASLREIATRLDRPALIGDAARIEALTAAATGDLDAAATWAGAAVEAHGRSPLRLELARSLLVLGRIERRRKARGRARDALRRAQALADEMGHRPLQAEIDQELPRIAAARSGGELTAAEQRVGDQIAAGATNREIAAALFISVRTVETHVASIYRKLGVPTRSELRRTLSARSRPRVEKEPHRDQADSPVSTWA